MDPTLCPVCGHELWHHDDDEGCCVYLGEPYERVTVCGCTAQLVFDEPTELDVNDDEGDEG